MLFFITFLLALSMPQAASAYVDPGTTTSVFGIIATIVSGAGVIGAFLIRPVIRVFRRKKQSDVSQNKSDTPPPPPVA